MKRNIPHELAMSILYLALLIGITDIIIREAYNNSPLAVDRYVIWEQQKEAKK